MGAGESKLSVASTPKLEPSQRPRAARVARLSDPRSPSCAIDRTPIQVGVAYSPLPVAESVGPVFDPRSPTPGITRTPVKVSFLHQVTSALPESSHEQQEESKPPTPQSVVSSKSSPVEMVQSGIRCLKFDTRSPSQAIFKPQWLGVGFGSTGVRARGVQARGKTSVSSPLSTKNTATNENNNMVVRTKQRPREKVLVGEGRSPLQILREANSPRDRNSQMKLKVSTPEKQRFSQMDRRALILSLNKENE
ncbi:cell division cycle-associated protein 3 [Sinocyclocheilus grahami]|uniref:cell division cycle-associated protein 3 n=1 Tax=Sinocyclocheilus grahami TaxID=75366 RepID=UPI0007AD008D|nr:PREDICTED: cell division cycle-associated protein 3 [Sinocyclocheilus grahami]